nr:MAG TPA: hypothetical protein [Bacteriophage sp.]
MLFLLTKVLHFYCFCVYSLTISRRKVGGCKSKYCESGYFVY